MGVVDDGYVCSSRWMRKSYKRRPQDFKRRIVYYHQSISRDELLTEETRWLQMIKDIELGKKYYNLSRSAIGGINNPKQLKNIKNTMKLRWQDPEYREKVTRVWRDPEHRKRHSEATREGTRRAMSDPSWVDVVEKQRAHTTARWVNTEYQTTMSEMSRQMWSKPERHKLQSDKITSYWSDQSNRDRVSKKCSDSWTPERRAAKAEEMRRRWAERRATRTP